MDEKQLIQIKYKIDNLEPLSQSDVEWLYQTLIDYKNKYERKTTIQKAIENAAQDVFELEKTRIRNKRQ